MSTQQTADQIYNYLQFCRKTEKGKQVYAKLKRKTQRTSQPAKAPAANPGGEKTGK